MRTSSNANSGVSKKLPLFSIILPGMLIAATGIGAGDLATASFSGSQLGVTVLWAVAIGGVFKFILTEGLARWQLVTGSTFLEGAFQRTGKPIIWLFLIYLFFWSFFVGSALISACGVALHAIFPFFASAYYGKLVFGIISSALAILLISNGSFGFFSKLMSACIGIMFITVCVTAILLWPGTAPVLKGIFIPSIPDVGGSGLTWAVALIGGVGGTLTILCYGYWIKENGRTSAKDINVCRLDLLAGYSVTILFGMAMVIIGSTIETDGRGADLLVKLADRLEAPLGVTGRWIFLLGAFSAVFSSLLGVLQAVPYIFADVWFMLFPPSNQYPDSSLTTIRSDKAFSIELTKTTPYKLYAIALATVPIFGLLISFKEVQKLYALVGVSFLPLLALGLIYMNSRKEVMGDRVNSPLGSIALLFTLFFFGAIAALKWA